MRLELGSGGRPTDGYTHLDCRDLPDVDIIDDAATLGFIDLNSCIEIRACHLLEHFSWRETEAILAVWRDRLNINGLLHIEVPNLEGHILAWQSTRSTVAQFVEYLYGSQDYPENTHMTAFTPWSLDRALRAVGFRDITIRNLGLVIVAQARR